MGIFSSLVAESAGTPASGIQSTLQSGFQSIASDMTSTVTTVLPIILGVVGLVLVVGFAVRFFKKNAK